MHNSTIITLLAVSYSKVCFLLPTGIAGVGTDIVGRDLSMGNIGEDGTSLDSRAIHPLEWIAVVFWRVVVRELEAQR